VNNRLRPSAAPGHTPAMRNLLALHCLLFLGAVQAASPLDAGQRALIDAQLASFPAEPAPAGRVYFLGFAGHGEQRVFAEEIKLASQRVAERYGSTRHSVLLVNDRRDLKTWPQASADSLRYAVDALAHVMNLDEDVLFLALSSHGWKDATIDVSNEGMEPEALSAGTVANILAEAGIRWKVVVVSACFSGTFVKPLADDHSIVITAASRRRTSFGCSDTRELTYFGEAFYRDAFARFMKLRDVFGDARRSIFQREQDEGFRPSQPQGSFAPLLEEKLAGLSVR